MQPTVAIVAQGAMGAGIARRLADNGVEVRTSLEGRGAASERRAAAAGMRVVATAELVATEFVLSIVPPAAAVGFAERLAPFLRTAPRKPVFVDCNAVSPATVQRIASIVGQAGAAFVDAGIIGGPPRPGEAGPHVYAAGEHAPRFAALAAHGLDIRLLEGPVGAASALKMCFAGINKGLIAIAAAMALAAARAGAAEALCRELAESEPRLLESLARKVPNMLPKAYRWGPEMQEIAGFAAPDAAAAAIYAGAARLYEQLAGDVAADGPASAALLRFFTDPAGRSA